MTSNLLINKHILPPQNKKHYSNLVFRKLQSIINILQTRIGINILKWNLLLLLFTTTFKHLMLRTSGIGGQTPIKNPICDLVFRQAGFT